MNYMPDAWGFGNGLGKGSPLLSFNAGADYQRPDSRYGQKRALCAEILTCRICMVGGTGFEPVNSSV
jgi:hypothetical protein